MATTLIRNAQAIVTVDREDRVLRNGNILVEDNIIRYIGPAERAADRVIDASHCFVYPGLVNTHHHLYQTFTRNLPQVQKMELFPWQQDLGQPGRSIGTGSSGRPGEGVYAIPGDPGRKAQLGGAGGQPARRLYLPLYGTHGGAAAADGGARALCL